MLDGLTNACITGNLDLVNLAIQNGQRPGPQTLNYAINSNNADIVKAVCFAGAPPTDDTLTRACFSGQKAILDFAIVAGAKVRSDTLTAAAKSGSIEIFNLVITLAAKPDHETLSAVLPKWPWIATWLVNNFSAKADSESLTKSCQVKQDDPNGRDKTIEAVVNAGGKPNATTLYEYMNGCTWTNGEHMNCNQVGIDALIKSGLTYQQTQYGCDSQSIYGFLKKRTWHLFLKDHRVFCIFLITIGFKPTSQEIQTHLREESNYLERCRINSKKKHLGDDTRIDKAQGIINNAIGALSDAYYNKYKIKL